MERCRHLEMLDRADAEQLSQVDPLAGLPDLCQKVLELRDCRFVPGAHVGKSSSFLAKRLPRVRVGTSRLEVEQLCDHGHKSPLAFHIDACRIDQAGIRLSEKIHEVCWGLNEAAASVNHVNKVVRQVNDCPDSLMKGRRPEWRKRGLALLVLWPGRAVRSLTSGNSYG